MEQLLSIKHIPIKIEVNVTNAEFKPKADSGESPSVKVSKNSGGVQVAAQPYKVDISSAQRYDTYTPAQQQNSGVTLTYEGIARLASSSDEAQAAKTTGDGAKLAARNASRSIEAILSKLPKSKSSNISYNDGTLSIHYSMEKSETSEKSESLDLSSGFEFIPGSIEFVVSQMPDLEIEYLGDPIYFPRSADPNYEGEVDVIA